MSTSSPDSKQLLEQASEWLVKMTSDTCTEQDRLEFIKWREQSDDHRSAAKRIQSIIDRFQTLQASNDPTTTRTIIENSLIDQPKFKFKPNLQNTFLSCLAILSIIFIWILLPINYWLSEHNNQFNSWNKQTLTDQSEIQISGQSAYNLNFNKEQRIVELLEGNILVQVAKDINRPFIIQTEFASIKALGTRFIVNQTPRYTILTMIESKVEVKTKQESKIIHAGQQAIINKNGEIRIKDISAQTFEMAWDKHSLVVEEMPLDQVLDILNSYQDGKLYYNSDDMKKLKVTAILPLDKKDQAFYLLQDSLPIQINQPIPYLKVISKK